MADSDGEYIDSGSSDDGGAHRVTRGGVRTTTTTTTTATGSRARGTASGGGGGGGSGSGGGRSHARRSGAGPATKARWEDLHRSWEKVVEGADGSLRGAVDGVLEGAKRARLQRDTTPLQRGIIRHLVLVLDASAAMAETDLRPTRFLLTLRYAGLFVREFFEQNPLGQLAVLAMRDGLAVRVSALGGNPAEHSAAMQALRPVPGAGAGGGLAEAPTSGYPSVQNALEMARGVLYQAPAHGTREVVVVLGALLSCDPGDIHQTVRALVRDRVRVSVVGLAAEVAVCRAIVAQTNEGSDAGYGVALNEEHFRDLFLAATTPPVTPRSATHAVAAASLLMMGFPSRTLDPSSSSASSSAASSGSLCACHGRPVPVPGGGYRCSRCRTKVCSLPCDCPACGLTLILSTHLARSYHHLFPLPNWSPVPSVPSSSSSAACFACQTPFPPVPVPVPGAGVGVGTGSSSSRAAEPRLGLVLRLGLVRVRRLVRRALAATAEGP
ncbi:MAG: hypothetical protein M1826_003957 [Phylliscum demangeonii]|nr:MAG: hypothetical protein M1826_003957 [Phylliscum demangeonii]